MSSDTSARRISEHGNVKDVIHSEIHGHELRARCSVLALVDLTTMKLTVGKVKGWGPLSQDNFPAHCPQPCDKPPWAPRCYGSVGLGR